MIGFEERASTERTIRHILARPELNMAGEVSVTPRALQALVDTIDALVNAENEDSVEVAQLKARVTELEHLRDVLYEQKERAEVEITALREMHDDYVARQRKGFIRQAFLAIVKASGDGAGCVSFNDDWTWEQARIAWEKKPEDC